MNTRTTTKESDGSKGMTYQSTAYYQSEDGQMIALTGRETAHLPDWELIPIARGEADRIGLDLGDSLIVIGEWV